MLKLLGVKKRLSTHPAKPELIDRYFSSFADEFCIGLDSGIDTIINFKVDIWEDDSCYYIIGDLPGINASEVKIEYGAPYLTIKAEMESEMVISNRKMVRRERMSGVYNRSFYIEGIKGDEVRYQVINGILKIEIPKQKVNG